MCEVQDQQLHIQLESDLEADRDLRATELTHFQHFYHPAYQILLYPSKLHSHVREPGGTKGQLLP